MFDLRPAKTSDSEMLTFYNLHCIAEIRAYWVESKPFQIGKLDIITRLLDNAAFVCVDVVGRFSKDFSQVRWLKSRGFQF